MENVQTPSPAASSNAASGDNKVVFIIEDDDFLVRAYKYIFEKEGISVWVATDGDQAKMYLDEKPAPRVVLLDLMLPGISGFDILEAIGKNEKWKSVPVIILSNLGQPEDIQRGKDLGAIDYLVKANTDITNIVSRVKEFLK